MGLEDSGCNGRISISLAMAAAFGVLRSRGTLTGFAIARMTEIATIAQHEQSLKRVVEVFHCLDSAPALF